MASPATSSRVLPKPERAQQISQNSRNGNTQQHSHFHSVRSGNGNHHHRSNKAPASRRSVTPTTSRSHSSQYDDNDAGRVRVAVRVRPRNTEELISDADFADSVELVPELRRLKLRKNNWSSESYRFDEVFSETASQKRVYQVVAKPVVESVLNGYNGTVMAYGQTGTGKTYTVGRLGKDDAAERGIMVRALEDVIANINPAYDVLEVSYLQLYMESIQDLLAPEKINIPINEDPRTGEVSLPGATVVRVRGLHHFSELLQIGEANRYAANTKQNTESSRSHAILMVYVRRSINQKAEDGITSLENYRATDLLTGNGIPIVRKSKLLIVDLAGSERLNKSGSEGHLVVEAKFINLSLSSLGKCINALAENNPHIPTRESKLTRLLRDSFGGSSRTSLIITIGPSARHHAETTSTVVFGQRAMKIVNVVKLKEEFDYESLCRKLETQMDHLTAEIEREQKLREQEKCGMEKQLKQCQEASVEAKKCQTTRSEFLEKENTRLQQGMKVVLNELDHQKGLNSLLSDKVAQLEMSLQHSQELQEVDELRVKIQEIYHLNDSTRTELQSLKAEHEDLLQEKATLSEELYYLKKKFSVEEKLRKSVEDELAKLKKTCVSDNDYEDKKSCMKENIGHGSSVFSNSMKSNSSRTTLSGQRAMIAKICEEAGLQKILKLLTSEDSDVQTQAVKLIANLAAEDINQEKILKEGGLDALLILLRSSQNTTILRVASGAIANLAMNELNQGLIMSKGGAQLLAVTASRTDDPQTLRMVAGALANLCGNERLHMMLKEDGGTKALLGMVRTENTDVIAQIARGMANFAKCESRGIIQGHRRGRSLLIEDGALEWLIANANVIPTSTRRHVELALCHLAQNEDNVRDFITLGGVKELKRISVESIREDIRNLAKKMLNISPTFQAVLHP